MMRSKAIRSLLLIIAVGGLLGGCAGQKIAKWKAMCDQRWPTLTPEKADCLTEIEARYPDASMPPDLVNLYRAQRRMMYRNVETGTMVREQADLELAKFATGLTEQNEKRKALILSSQPVPVYVGGPSQAESLLSMSQQLMNPPRAINTTCTKTGPFTNCSTY